MVTADDYMRAERELTLDEWRRGWRLHAAIYAVVITMLTALNVLLVLVTELSFLWFPFPLAGWGLGVALHYVFGVRRAEREIATRQGRIRTRAERLHTAA